MNLNSMASGYQFDTAAIIPTGQETWRVTS